MHELGQLKKSIADSVGFETEVLSKDSDIVTWIITT
jgi:hypothetical protein